MAERHYTAADVRYYYERGLSAVNSAVKNYDENIIFDSRLDELKSLAIACRFSELEFFREIGITTNDPKEALKILQKKIDKWNQDAGAADMIMGRVKDICLEIEKKYRGIDFDQLTQAYSQEVFSDIMLKRMAVDDAVTDEEIKEIFAAEMSKISKSVTSGKRGFNAKKLNERVEITYVRPSRNTKAQLIFKLDGNMSSDYKTRLAKIYNEVVGAQQQQVKVRSPYNPEDKQEIIKDITDTITANIGGEAAKYINNEIKLRFSDYGIAENLIVIKGFLGEIYWNAFFKYLGFDTVPTGVVKDLKNRSIPIDMILKDAGFQIKNYTIDEKGKVVFQGSNQAANFITSRAQIPSPLSEILINLFATYGYNLPVDDATERYENLYKHIEHVVTPTDERYMNSVFKLYVDRIIGLDKKFGVSSKAAENIPFFDMGENEALYFNTFFLIQDKIVPSSSIIEAIVEEYRKESDKIKFSAIYTTNSIKQWDQELKGTMEKTLANYTKIAWEVTINVENVIQAAYKSAN